MSVNHVQPHLVIGDVKAGQWLIPQFRANQTLGPVAHDRQTALIPLGKSAPPGLDELRSGYALASSVQPRRILILIDAAVSP
jgi:hypothetical protein